MTYSGTIRAAQLSEAENVLATVTSAFLQDPLWGPVFEHTDDPVAASSDFWRLSVTSSLRYPWTFTTENYEAVAVWTPLGGVDMTAEEEAGLGEFLVNILGRERADSLLTLFDQFEAARPTEPHAYLNIFGTHSDHRGKGIGMSLLRENLARIDALHQPAYLESSNPANNERYGGVGFTPVGEFVSYGGQTVTTMWREAR